MLRNSLKKFIFVFILSACAAGCQRQNAGFLLFTFDDSSADAWVVEAAPLLLKNGASATFYVSQFYELNEAQRQKIASLQKMGFEIGYHSTNHLNTQEYLATNALDSFWRTQILPDLRLLHRYGIYPKNYAHPFCATTAAADSALRTIFCTVRHCEFARPDRPLAQLPIYNLPNTDTLRASGVDAHYNVSDAQITDALTQCAKTGTALMLYAHNIGSDAKNEWQISPARLAFILQKAQELHITTTSVANWQMQTHQRTEP